MKADEISEAQKIEHNMEQQNAARDNQIPYQETYRPQFHYTARKGLLNCPSGLVYQAGEYHLLFQHNPAGNNWGNFSWGHAISTDLFRWRALPSAIEPDNIGTVFSGSAIQDTDNTAGFQTGDEPALVAMYTAAGGSSPESDGKLFTQCIAFSNNRARTWTKYANNPVIPNIVGENRDPKVIWYDPGKFWVMALFLDGESFALFTSPNLTQWTRIQTLSVRGSECPDFFPLKIEGERDEERWIFMVGNGNYLIGSFNGKHFETEAGPFALDLGSNYYASQTFGNIPDSDGRRIQLAWLAGGVYPDMPFNQQMSVPTSLTLHNSGGQFRLHRNPVVEIESLYAGLQEWKDLDIKPGENPLQKIQGDLFDISLEASWQEPSSVASSFGFRIRGVEIRFDCSNHTLSCMGRSVKMTDDKNSIKIRVLVDRTSIELFIDDGLICMSFCFTPSPANYSLEFFCDSLPVHIETLSLHILRSAWSNDSASAE